MDAAALEGAITPRTKTIMPVHLFGHPADMDAIVGLAQRHRIPVIEDACQAHGAEYRGRRAGSIGDIGCFSFYPGKNLGAYGEGGAAVTSNPGYADTMRLLRAWGERTRYEHSIRGFNYRMDGIQGAILGVKLKHLEQWTEARRAHAGTYRRLLAGTAARTPSERDDVRHVYHVYAVRLSQRDAWREAFGTAGVQTGIHYPIPVHLQPAYRDLGYARGDFPVAERLAAEVLSLPMFPELTPSQLDVIAGVIRAGLTAPAPA
jgi:dTDP-4-amino-4,6-dideoxygalactose transaminase